MALAIPGVGVLGSFGIVVAMLIFHRDARNAALRLWKRGPVTSLLIGLAVGVVTHFLMSALLEPALQHMLGQQVDLSQFDTVKNNLANYLVLLAIGLLFGGIVEELIFRGYIIGWVQNCWEHAPGRFSLSFQPLYSAWPIPIRA
ncbi:MAG: hypothetical protein RH945_07360 [Hyphomonas sp.]